MLSVQNGGGFAFIHSCDFLLIFENDYTMINQINRLIINGMKS